MDDGTGKVVAFSVIKVSVITSSNAMEDEGFKDCMESQEGNSIEINCIATDRHVSIISFMNE